jgi:putative endonuclease
MFYVYVLRSKRDDDLYVGATSNLKQRLEDHNTGAVESTRGRRPFELVYYEAGLERTKAFEREKYFKTGFGRRFLSNRI